MVSHNLDETANMSRLKHNICMQQTALDICAELSARIGPLADEAGVDEIIAGYTSKPLRLHGENGKKDQMLYIDLYASIRDFTSEEKAQSTQYERTADAAHELQRMLTDTIAVLSIAAQSGIAEMLLHQEQTCNFCDDICFAGQTRPCGLLLVCMTLLPADEIKGKEQSQIMQARRTCFTKLVANSKKQSANIEDLEAAEKEELTA